MQRYRLYNGINEFAFITWFIHRFACRLLNTIIITSSSDHHLFRECFLVYTEELGSFDGFFAIESTRRFNADWMVFYDVYFTLLLRLLNLMLFNLIFKCEHGRRNVFGSNQGNNVIGIDWVWICPVIALHHHTSHVICQSVQMNLHKMKMILLFDAIEEKELCVCLRWCFSVFHFKKDIRPWLGLRFSWI